MVAEQRAVSLSEQTWKHIEAEDHRWRGAETEAALELMKLRWHWTRNPENPERVSLSAYGDHVGVSKTAVYRDAKGYELIVNTGINGGLLTPHEARARAQMSTEREVVNQAVADAHHVSIETVRRQYGDEARAVRQEAQQRAEDHGTTVAQEAHAVAQERLAQQERDKRYQEDQQRAEELRLKRLGQRFLHLERELIKARRHVAEFVRQSADFPFTDEQRLILADSLRKTREMIDMADAVRLGHVEQDWSDKLRVIEGGA